MDPIAAHPRLFAALCSYAAAGVLPFLAGHADPGAASVFAGLAGLAVAEGWHNRRAGGRRWQPTTVFERWQPVKVRPRRSEREIQNTMQTTAMHQKDIQKPTGIIAGQAAPGLTDDQMRIVAEARMVNNLFSARKVAVKIPRNGRGLPAHYLTPSTVVYDLEVPMNISGDKLVTQQDDALAYIRQFRRMNGVRSVDHSGLEVMPTVRVDRYDHTIEISRPKPDMLTWDDVAWEPRPMTALCGLRHDHTGATPVLWDLSRPDQPHGLIAGTTGSGKTNALLVTLYSLMLHNAPQELQITIADPKHGDGVNFLDELPHVRSVARDLADVMHVIEKFHQEMMHRERGDMPRDIRHILAVEECASLTEHPDKAMRDRVLYWLADIARRSRENNMNLIICTQKPTAEVLGDQLKSNLPVRMVGAVNSKDDALTALNVKQSGAEMLPGYGAFIFRLNRTMHRYQTPLVNQPAELCQAIQLRWGSQPYTMHRSAPPMHHLAPPLHQSAPVHTGASDGVNLTRVGNTNTFAPVQFPLIEKRPLTPAEANNVRYLAGQMSKNRLCVHVYGAKSPRYMAWIDEALNRGE